MTRPLAIIQLEVPPPFVQEQVGEQHNWFVQALALNAEEYVVVRPDLGDNLPDPATISAAILSGSWAMVTDHADWSERTAAWIRTAIASQLPLLGVCYGHQLMAYALGGEVGDNPQGGEYGVQHLTLAAAHQHDPLLAALPSQFTAWLSHRQSVRVPPQGAQVLAGSAKDTCQIIRYSPQALSTQFHPEFTREIMLAGLHNSVGEIQAHAMLQGQGDPQWPLQLLQAFWQSAQPVVKRA